MYFFSADVYSIKRILNINNIFYENYFFENINYIFKNCLQKYKFKEHFHRKNFS